MIAVAMLVLGPALASVALTPRQARPLAVRVCVAVAAVATALAIGVALTPTTGTHLGGFVRIDPTSRLFLAIVNPIFLGISVYVWSWTYAMPALREGAERFAWLALAFLAATNAVLVANHLGVLWIALEVSTFALAPLIVRPGVPASSQASWRYLLFSAVGLALVCLGLVCLARGAAAGGPVSVLFVDGPRPAAAGAVAPWTNLGLALVLLGLGTKLGLAPMYSWLPETYEEAPTAVAALLGAVQFNAALVVLIRVVQVWRPVNPALVTGALVTMGTISLVVSTFHIIATRNLPRLIAYASINHAAVIAIGLGVGRTGAYGLLLYVISNAFIKAILFLTAGRIQAHYRTRDTRQILGLIRDLPYSGVFLMVGTFALLGLPPFGSFFGELLILSALVSSGHLLVFAAFCVLITMTFVATGRTIFPMIWGEPTEPGTWPRQTFWSASPKIAFLAALVVLGIYIPPVVNGLIQQVAVSLEGS